MVEIPSFRHLTDEELLLRIKTFAQDERRGFVHFLACLSELERRNLHIKEGCPSLFVFCMRVLRYSEDAAYRRICVARAASRFLEIYSLLNDGSLSLTAAACLAPHLTRENRQALLARAQGKNKREVDMIVASLAPKNDIVDRMRHLPLSEAPTPAAPQHLPTASETAPLPAVQSVYAQRIFPSAPQRVQFSFTGSEDLLHRIQRARELLRHKYPLGKLEDVFYEVTSEFLASHDPGRRVPSKERPPREKESRRVPRWVKDRVWRRDGGKCSYIGASGDACGARDWLEYDHRVPWARGGRSDDPRNIRLLCRAHNQQASCELFGDLFRSSEGR